jgi:threonine aldolase
MRQAGILAAAGIEAIENMADRLHEDHMRAHELASGLQNVEGIVVEKNPPPTNMVFLRVAEESPLDAYEWAGKLKEQGIRISPVEERRIRMVVHYWISDENVEETVRCFRKIAGS